MDMSRQQAEPLYLELANILRAELGSYTSGDYLPPEVQLAGVAVVTCLAETGHRSGSATTVAV